MLCAKQCALKSQIQVKEIQCLTQQINLVKEKKIRKETDTHLKVSILME